MRIDAFDHALLGSRLLVFSAAGSSLVGTVSQVSADDLTLDGGEAIAPRDIRRLWILRPSEALVTLSAVGNEVQVLLANGRRLMGSVLEHLAFGGFRLLCGAEVSEIAWLDVQSLEVVP